MTEYFEDEMNRTFSLYLKKTGLDGGSPAEGFETVASLTDITAAFFEGGAAESLVSDRYKTILSGTVIAAPGISIPDGSKLVLDDGAVHYVIHANNPLNLDEVLVVALRYEE